MCNLNRYYAEDCQFVSFFAQGDAVLWLQQMAPNVLVAATKSYSNL